MGSLLESDEVLKRGLDAITRADPIMRALVAAGARPTLRKRPPGFEGLAWIIVGQQLSTASATAIWERTRQLFDADSPQDFLMLSDEHLRRAGLSIPKINALRAAATDILDGSLPLGRLQDLPADEAHRLLTSVKGIGPWTADVYLLFCLGHPDAFPSGDLAVQEAVRLAYGLKKRPGPKELISLAENWRPWRGVAAKVLWAYYRIAKTRDGSPLR